MNKQKTPTQNKNKASYILQETQHGKQSEYRNVTKPLIDRIIDSGYRSLKREHSVLLEREVATINKAKTLRLDLLISNPYTKENFIAFECKDRGVSLEKFDTRGRTATEQLIEQMIAGDVKTGYCYNGDDWEKWQYENGDFEIKERGNNGLDELMDTLPSNSELMSDWINPMIFTRKSIEDGSYKVDHRGKAYSISPFVLYLYAQNNPGNTEILQELTEIVSNNLLEDENIDLNEEQRNNAIKNTRLLLNPETEEDALKYFLSLSKSDFNGAFQLNQQEPITSKINFAIGCALAGSEVAMQTLISSSDNLAHSIGSRIQLNINTKYNFNFLKELFNTNEDKDYRDIVDEIAHNHRDLYKIIESITPEQVESTKEFIRFIKKHNPDFEINMDDFDRLIKLSQISNFDRRLNEDFAKILASSDNINEDIDVVAGLVSDETNEKIGMFIANNRNLEISTVAEQLFQHIIENNDKNNAKQTLLIMEKLKTFEFDDRFSYGLENEDFDGVMRVFVKTEQLVNDANFDADIDDDGLTMIDEGMSLSALELYADIAQNLQLISPETRKLILERKKLGSANLYISKNRKEHHATKPWGGVGRENRRATPAGSYDFIFNFSHNHTGWEHIGDEIGVNSVDEAEAFITNKEQLIQEMVDSIKMNSDLKNTLNRDSSDISSKISGQKPKRKKKLNMMR